MPSDIAGCRCSSRRLMTHIMMQQHGEDLLRIVTCSFRCAKRETLGYVLQVQAELKMVPERLRGYIYSLGSLLLGALLGVIVYGGMVWAS